MMTSAIDIADGSKVGRSRRLCGKQGERYACRTGFITCVESRRGVGMIVRGNYRSKPHQRVLVPQPLAPSVVALTSAFRLFFLLHSHYQKEYKRTQGFAYASTAGPRVCYVYAYIGVRVCFIAETQRISQTYLGSYRNALGISRYSRIAVIITPQFLIHDVDKLLARTTM